ncbi:MAG TPA: hypothetical protein VFE12_09710, partial [Acetobacteraceae bacterium]|nr:hypothetical protein [Acetobacteraceae bacterium]
MVVSVDHGRLAQYRAALRMAGVTAALTSDADEAETWLRERVPTSMVLDQGLPRMTVFRLYGLVRAEESMRGIAVLFVGQEGEGSSEDYYLPADASPLVVAAQAQQLAAEHAQATAAAPPETTPSLQPVQGGPAAAPTSPESWTLAGTPDADAGIVPSR